MRLSNHNIGVFGMIGTGKTLYAMSMFRDRDRVLVVDLQGEYVQGFVVSDPMQMVEYLRKNERFRVIFLPLESGDFDFACRIVMAKGNMTVVLEEVSNYCSTAKLEPYFRSLMLRGRHSQVSTIYTAQRFAEVHRTVTSMTHEFVLFRILEPRDLVAVEQRFGPAVAEKVRILDDLEYVSVLGKRKHEGAFSVGTVGVGGRRIRSQVPAGHSDQNRSDSPGDPDEYVD